MNTATMTSPISETLTGSTTVNRLDYRPVLSQKKHENRAAENRHFMVGTKEIESMNPKINAMRRSRDAKNRMISSDEAAIHSH